MSAITIFVVSVVAYYSISSAKKARESEKPPSIEELGLQLPGGTSVEEAEMLSDGAGGSRSGWAFWPQSAGAPAKGKRVGAEDEEAQ